MNRVVVQQLSEVFMRLSDEEYEIVLEDIDYGFLEDLDIKLTEKERSRYINVREKLGLILELISDSSQVSYDYPPRTRHEINGGYKIAKRRGARLEEVEVFNLYFRFRSHLRGDGIALMYRPNGTNKKERIILLPDDTSNRVAAEQAYLRREARQLVLTSLMDPDNQSILLENLRLLNIHERCAQSLMHEFGHVLHWREFEALNFHEPIDIYKWFVENGYIYNMDKRFPGFVGLHSDEKLHILKESLVEDYRISLNMSDENGKFILPNQYCFSGDFQKPELLQEGVEIMKRMLNSQIQSSKRPPASSSELDTLEAYRAVVSRRRSLKWIAGTQSIDADSIRSDVEELKKAAYYQAAAVKQ